MASFFSSAEIPVIRLDGRSLTLPQLEELATGRARAALTPAARRRMEASAARVREAAQAEPAVYGINTGFGRFAEVRISPEAVDRLQVNLVRSHAAGVGPRFEDEIVRGMIITRANVLATGHCGVRPVLVDHLLALHGSGVIPEIPAQGSVGACGDLAPLSHLALVLIGEGWGRTPEGNRLGGTELLEAAGLQPLRLQAKEGLALLNGTQASLATGARALQRALRLAVAADLVGAMSVEGLMGSTAPFRQEVYQLRPHRGVDRICENIRSLLEGSAIRESHRECGRVQDAYCLRCMPQVHGAVRAALEHVENVVTVELNAVTDNPMVLLESGELLSAGNFHGEPLALAFDYLAIALSEMAGISERRIAAMMEAPESELATFLTEREGLQSGFMMAQVTAAALVSENKVLAHPASVDSIPTGAGREDHVSMSTIAARKALAVSDHTLSVLAIEALCAAQAIDFHAPLTPGRGTGGAWRRLRETIPHLGEDRPLGPDIEAVRRLIEGEALRRAAEAEAGALG